MPKRPPKFQRFLNKDVYQEEDDSMFTHHGVLYNLNTVLRLVQGSDPVSVPMHKLHWNITVGLDEERIERADTSFAILVVLEKGVYYVVDGNHRLVKLYRESVREVPVILVSESVLQQARVKD